MNHKHAAGLVTMPEMSVAPTTSVLDTSSAYGNAAQVIMACFVLNQPCCDWEQQC